MIKRYNLSEETVAAIFAEMERVSFPKKEMVQQEGGMDHYIYFVEQGIVRTFIHREDKTVTLWIVSEGGCPLSFSSLTRPGRSLVGMETLTDCVMWRMSRRRLGELCAASVDTANFARELAEEFVAETQRFFADYYGRDKKEQYKMLLGQCPDLFQRVPLSEIASYLAVTPQSLSRIRTLKD